MVLPQQYVPGVPMIGPVSSAGDTGVPLTSAESAL
jgi:hypothetical protein